MFQFLKKGGNTLLLFQAIHFSDSMSNHHIDIHLYFVRFGGMPFIY